MVPDFSRLVRGTTLLLMALAAVAVEVTAASWNNPWPVPPSLGRAAVLVALAVLLGWFSPRPESDRESPPSRLSLVPAGLFLAAFVIEQFQRRWTGEGHPLEIQLLFGLRNAGLGLAALGVWLLYRRLAAAVSLFLMLFALSMTEHRAVMVLLGLYGVAGSVWLVLTYWEQLRPSFVGAEARAVVEVQPGRQRLPWWAVAATATAAVAVLALVAAGPRRTARILGEWLPTSGGTGDYDRFARGGLNDGDEEVSGQDARSTGMVPSESFLESPMPSLYDLINDTYGEPFKPKGISKAIALSDRSRPKEGRKPPADNLRPNREFSTVRRSPRRPRNPKSRAARALFEVRGRTPLHIRAAAFDAFDGVAWQEAAPACWTGLLDKERDSNWMKVRRGPRGKLLGEVEAHQFKIATSFGTLLPTPPHLLRVRIGRVDRADFFAWGPAHILRLSGGKVPSGVCVETESCVADPSRLKSVSFGTPPAKQAADCLRLPPKLNPKIAVLAKRWAAGQPRGWAQIDAVVQRLRNEYVLDWEARAPAECRDPLAYFLLESRRGPDYQFASAAAVLLRCLGYPVRVVSGFYVDPEHYDAETEHTPVTREDLHFWAEVRLRSGDWLVLEPTPGYAVLRPSPPWTERLLAALLAAGSWARQHSWGLGLSLVVVAVLWWRRRELRDRLAVAWWRLFPGRSWQQAVGRCARLLERRCRWAGRIRPASRTLARWLPGVLSRGAGILPAEELEQLARMTEWAAYAPDLTPPWDEVEVCRLCRRVLDDWTFRRLRAATPNGVSR